MKYSHLLLPLILDPCGEAEVGDLHLHTLTEQHVAELQVTVNDAFTMDVLTSVHQVAHVEAHLGFCQGLAAFEDMD